MTHRFPDLPPQHTMAEVLETVEVLFPSGAVRYRFTRYLSADGAKSVRHGRFAAYHASGTPAVEGTYRDGFEVGLWRDFHENGQLAMLGCYHRGHRAGYWQFWSPDGTELDQIEYEHGVDVRDLPPDYDLFPDEVYAIQAP